MIIDHCSFTILYHIIPYVSYAMRDEKRREEEERKGDEEGCLLIGPNPNLAGWGREGRRGANELT